MPNIRTDTDTDTDTGNEHGWGWLHPAEPTALQAIPPTTDSVEDTGGNEWQWIDQQRPEPPQPTEDMDRLRVPRRVWMGLAAGLVVAAVLVGAGLYLFGDRPYTATVLPTLTASPPMTTPSVSGVCTGLAGEIVTDTAGDYQSLTGVIAAFEHAYYSLRSAEAALRLVAPEAGLDVEPLAAGIASVPAGTTHCVAITPIAEATAEVHVVERHPNGQRIDYLQLINARPDHGHMVITNIQKRS